MKKHTKNVNREKNERYMELVKKIDRIGLIGCVIGLAISIVCGFYMGMWYIPHITFTEEEAIVLEEIQNIAQENPEVVEKIRIDYFQYPVKVNIENGEIVTISNMSSRLLRSLSYSVYYAFYGVVMWIILFTITENSITNYIFRYSKFK